MFKRILAALAAGAILPVMWWNVVPNAADYCDGYTPVPTDYTLHGTDENGDPFTVSGTYTQDSRLCKMARDFPRPA